MNSGSAEAMFASFSREQKLRVLAQLCHNVTIVARDTYSADGGVVDAVRLRALNEIQHRVSAALMSLIDGTQELPPDEELAGMFFAERRDRGLRQQLVHAFERAVATVRQGIGFD